MKTIKITRIVNSIFLVILAFSLIGCSPNLTSLVPYRRSPGEVFLIKGENFGNTQGSQVVGISRCRASILYDVLFWMPEEIEVRLPSDLPSGNYKVLIYDDSDHTSSNSLDLWVTAASVPLAITDPYEVQVKSFRARYSKSIEWERWMLDNRGRYEAVFLKAKEDPCVRSIAFRYDTHPIAYNPPWDSEAQHMAALKALSDLRYPGYDFRLLFDGDTVSSYANAIAGIPTNESYASGKDVYLYYETIFDHEFAHIVCIPHHYDTDAEYGMGRHMPPGESRCLMDRSSNQFCSACRTALNIPLDVDNEEPINAASEEIRRRYPY
jgi:hypothetical protein